MKKFICAAALLGGTALTTHAQTTAGTVLLGGSFGFASGTTKNTSSFSTSAQETKSSSYSLAPRVGYFLADNLAVGLQLDFSRSKSKYTSAAVPNQSAYNTESTSTGYQIGPFVRYYKMLGDKAGFYGQLMAGYSRSEGESTTETPFALHSEQKSKGYYASFTPGFVFFPTDKLGLEVSVGNLGYGSSTTELKDSRPFSQVMTSERKDSGFGASFSLNALSIGAAFYVGR
ncbi:autotransporter outer membrane beta-barrel domain-containing protein [Hymenobacter elongatus]|uniref:Outer membrane protein beta-barrel domain-containing protein n=1 Tax=Hymenobacter elongatus TaxID=877208 RepID=A0A4Z0PIH6_9BACT|nr:autotransporter outer membrane beta-barrel domain-containing protein [Hymenobacter elongatus]TGE14933.1 hypothetical protein E5J99_14345 [Hymenobacter elongatus]